MTTLERSILDTVQRMYALYGEHTWSLTCHPTMKSSLERGLLGRPYSSDLTYDTDMGPIVVQTDPVMSHDHFLIEPLYRGTR